MKRRIIFLTCLLISIISSGQSKKKQIELLNGKLDSLNEVVSNERNNYTQVVQLKDSLVQLKDAEISSRKNQINQLIQGNERLITQLSELEGDKMILTKEQSSLERRIDSLTQIIAELTVNKEINSFRNSKNFENFLYSFLSTVYSNQKIDSLISISSPRILDFVEPSIGFGRFWNMGAACNLYNEGNYEYYDFPVQPDVADLPFFKDQDPQGGFCDEASTPDGIYYKQVYDLPEDWDVIKGESIPPPRKLKYLNKIMVQVQYNYWVVKTMYFIEFNDKWYLLYFDDCDCSA
ncbi:MAG: hypothetical protein L7U78_04015 [Schleiferiaceae bacterium]|nr:hypothetical protein [Schleiferiaceae bacterium]